MAQQISDKVVPPGGQMIDAASSPRVGILWVVIDKLSVVMKSRAAEACALAFLYLFLVSSFFFFVTILSGSEILPSRTNGVVGKSAAVDVVSGIASFATMSFAIWKLHRHRISYNLMLCFTVSTVVSLADFLSVMAYFSHVDAGRGMDLSFANNSLDLLLCWIVYLGWTCALLMLLLIFDVRDRERRLAIARDEALAAQMRALRYQVNPHFLFNTLNSIAGLIEEGAASRAERMALSLSTFLRTTLTLDPMHDVSLAVEISLQKEYLAVEQERYSDRMCYTIDVPDDVQNALVPNLILQPLIENALKHGVGRSSAPTVIRITARRNLDSLWITVENNVGTTPLAPNSIGFGIGLKNVADRILTRFGDRGHFDAGLAEDGLFRAKIVLPWRLADR